MSKVRLCDKRCHEAKGTRCRCWCHGMFHGKKGVQSPEWLQGVIKETMSEAGVTPETATYVPSEPKQGALL